MIIMMYAAVLFGADDALARKSKGLLEKGVRYLDRYGEDPGEQLCTDDYAGHLAHNANLAAKAMVAVACYARLLERFGRHGEADRWRGRAEEMADNWLARANRSPGGFSLTLDGNGWSILETIVSLLPSDGGIHDSSAFISAGKKGL